MAININNFDSVVNAALDFYVRGDALAQNIQDKPLLQLLDSKKKTFPSGKQYISRGVQGAWASDVGGFFQGYSQADVVGYVHPDNELRAQYPWKEVHAGITLTLTELKQDGVSVVDSLNGDKTVEHNERELTAITDLLQNKLDDMGQSWAIKFNDMCWRDGTQDPKAVPGLLSLLTDTPAVGLTGGLNRANYAWWRHRALIGAAGIMPSAADQTLTRKLRYEVRQLSRYGAKPDSIFAGSDFIDALELEVQAKGIYTQEGFKNDGKTDIGMADISMRGVGRVQYDPTLDALGANYSKRAYFLSSKQVQLMPMEGEDKKVHTPARPFDQYVILRGMTWTGGLVCWQQNCNGIYEVK